MPAILCPRCRKLINSEVSECPFCGMSRPGMWGFATALRKLGTRVDFPHLITYVCVGVYVLALLSDPRAIFQSGGMMNLLAPSNRASFWFGATGSLPVFRFGHWWTVITAIYLHGNLLHIFFNMMWVRQLGPVVGDLFGPFRLFIIFTVAGISGFLLSTIMGHTLTLGASGSIFGLLAAAIEYGRRAGSSMFTRQFLQWAAILFVFGFIFPGVDNWAHAGGFVGGYGVAFLFGQQQGVQLLGVRQNDEGIFAYVGAALCLLATVGAFMLQFLAMLELN